jgi:prophage regulatory protein
VSPAELARTVSPAALAQTVTDLTPPLLLRKPQVLAMVQVSETTLWRLIRAKKFPPSVQVAPNVVAWREADVRAWAQGLKPNNSN